MQDAELASLYSLFILALSQNNLSQVSFRLFNLKRPDKSQFKEENLSTEVTEEDLANAWTDEYGVKYSSDRKRLLKAPQNIVECFVAEGTIVICDYAFHLCDGLSVIRIPQSVKSIGDMAFCGCELLTSVLLPKKLKKISYKLFCGCEALESIAIPNGITSIGKEAFSWCKHLSSIIIPKSVEDIGEGAFSYTDSLKTISVNPENMYYDSRDNCNAIIESSSNTLIAGCVSTIISLNVEIIGPAAFMGITNLLSISLPNNVKIINNDAFCQCDVVECAANRAMAMGLGCTADFQTINHPNCSFSFSLLSKSCDYRQSSMFSPWNRCDVLSFKQRSHRSLRNAPIRGFAIPEVWITHERILTLPKAIFESL